MDGINGNCIFCRIIQKDIPYAIIYENDKFLAFMDKYPINHGHTLIVPKQHYSNILEMPFEIVGEMYSLVPRLAKAITSVIESDGFNINQNNGKSANQIVPHVHVHIVPRYSAEKVKGQWPTRKIAKMQELQDLAQKITASLAHNYE
ncbi:HIT family protein [Candidatus Nitrosocosmicus hydrocola]|jgi:histidine triad (HIT) family protein|uniref:HIT family protein n=1 Tax=Candidatus Nitrosocosmicus hydrocola TaxID=1826872 RepID=UPI001E5DAA7F|nr:HIT family protein [Candidatus Nitrosocosmicus hydrocola]